MPNQAVSLKSILDLLQGENAISDQTVLVGSNYKLADLVAHLKGIEAAFEAAVAVDDQDQLLSAESKENMWEIERMAACRPNEHGPIPAFKNSAYAWAYTRGDQRNLVFPSKSYDQIRLGLFFGNHGCQPREDYTDWEPIMTVAEHRAILTSMFSGVAVESPKLLTYKEARDLIVNGVPNLSNAEDVNRFISDVMSRTERTTF